MPTGAVRQRQTLHSGHLAGLALTAVTLTGGAIYYFARQSRRSVVRNAEERACFVQTPSGLGSGTSAVTKDGRTGPSTVGELERGASTGRQDAVGAMERAKPCELDAPTNARGVRGEKEEAKTDEDDFFATPGGPKLFSPDAVFSSMRTRGFNDATHLDGVNGGGSAGLGASAHERKPLGWSRPQEIQSDAIGRRTKILQVLQAISQSVGGVGFESSEEETDSDETDVSLNMHIAMVLEMQARDELLTLLGVEDGDSLFSGANTDSLLAANRPPTSDVGLLVTKLIEYFDMSIECERLRLRREDMHYEAGVSHARYSPHALDEARATARAADLGGEENGGRSLNYHGGSMLPSGMTSAEFTRMLQVRESEMDQKLHERGEEETFEDDWEDEDGAEADFMAFLQQEDSRSRFFTRQEMRIARQCPSQDIQLVAEDGRDFEDVLAELHEGEDEEEFYDDDDDEAEDENADDAYWSMEEKEAFETHLQRLIYELSVECGVTEVMVERMALRFEQARQKRREERAGLMRLSEHSPRAVGGESHQVDAGDEEEWVDEDDSSEWIDEDDDEQVWEVKERLVAAAHHSGNTAVEAMGVPHRVPLGYCDGVPNGVSARASCRGSRQLPVRPKKKGKRAAQPSVSLSTAAPENRRAHMSGDRRATPRTAKSTRRPMNPADLP